MLAAASLFFPMTPLLGVEVDCPFTPAMLKKVAHAGARSSSFEQAASDLEALAEQHVSASRVERWTKKVGDERLREVEQRSEAHRQLPIPTRNASPIDHVPQVAALMVDGGRIQIRDRRAPEKADSHWRETLVGCLLRMSSEEHGEDPCPLIPHTFVDPQRMHDLSRDIKGFGGDQEKASEVASDPPQQRDSCPEVLVKSVVATRGGQQVFAQRLVSEAYRRGFAAAPRKAFVADGAANNWSIHKQYFSDYTPIVDFTHAICYVYAAAMAGRHDGWDDYVQWAQWLWEGSTDKLIEAVAQRSESLGLPAVDDKSSPAAIVARTLGYLRNQQSRMKYAEYRRRGLPITSSHIESTIKQINRRVKGTEKFWHTGAEPLLQLAADHLGETDDFDRFWQRRTQSLAQCRCYQSAA